MNDSLYVVLKVYVKEIQLRREYFPNGMREGSVGNGAVFFCIDDELKSGLARDVDNRLQSRNVPFRTTGGCRKMIRYGIY